MRRPKFLAILLFILTLVLATCTGTNPDLPAPSLSDSGALRIWWSRGHYPEEDEALEEIIAGWQSDREERGEPALEVELSFYSIEDILGKTKSAVEAGNPPDLLFSSQTDLILGESWAADGILADVSDVIEPVKDLYSDSALKAAYFYNNVTKQGSYYAVPIYQQAHYLHYWRDLLAEVGFSEKDIPKDWNGFWEFWQEAADALRDRYGEDFYAMGFPMSVASVDTYFTFEQILEAYDVEIVGQASGLSNHRSGKLLLDRPAIRQKAIAALEWYVSLYQNGYVPPDAIKWLAADNNVTFLNRKVLIAANPSLSIPGSQREDEDIYRNKMATIELPNEPDGEPPKYLVTVKTIVAFAASKNQEAAKDFLSYLVEPERLGFYVKGSLGRWFPVMPELLADSFWQDKSDPHISVATEQFLEGKTRPFYQSFNPAYSRVSEENVWGKAMSRVIVDGLSPTEATDEAIGRIKEIFADWPSSE